mmetsp:Transcript_47854/g.96568  ORF Transcript_47854/g.96568 Transcript_47854/m.96568 type:complete len:272 (+) Transcript_47854:582-1397(+)
MRMCRRISADVELCQCWAALVERPLTKNKAMAVVVHMCKADPVTAITKYSQLPSGSCFHHVGEEQRVPRPVHLMRRDSNGEELVAASIRQELLPRRLGGRILLQVSALRNGGQIGLNEPLDVASIEARAWRRGHHDLRDAGIAAGLDHMAGAAIVHVLVELPRVEWSHSSTQMPHTISPCYGLGYGVHGAQIALYILYTWILPCTRRGGEDVEGHHAPRPPLHKHLHQPLPHEAAAARDHAVGGHGRVFLLRGPPLQRRECWRWRYGRCVE